MWTTDNPLIQQVAIPAGSTASGRLTFFGRIPAGQPAPTGTYNAYFFNSPLGYFNSACGRCEGRGWPDLQTEDFTLPVAAVLVEACTLSTISAVDFGLRSGAERQLDATGSIQLICPLSLAWTLSFGGGQNPSDGVRRMRSATRNLIAYRLYRDTGRTDPIEIDGTISGTGTGTVQSRSIFGRAEISELPTVGQYSDVVIVTLRF